MAVDSSGTEAAPRVSAGSRARDMVAAVVTGQFAGLAMLGTMMLFALGEGRDVLDPLRAIGSIGYGSASLVDGGPTLALGLVMHQFGFTLFWSFVFGFLLRNATRRNVFSVTALGMEDDWGTAVLGPLVGMVSNLIDVVVVMPAIAQDAAWTELFLGLRSWCYHLVFGIGLAFFPLIRRWLFGDR